MSTAVAPVPPTPPVVAPVAAPTTPVAPVPVLQGEPRLDQSGTYGVQDVLDSIATSAVTDTIAEQTEPAELQRNEKGQFLPRTEATPAVAPVAPVAVPQEGAPLDGAPLEDAPLVLPEGYVAVKPVDRQLHTPFKMFDGEGEIAVPDVLIEFKANGKVRKEPLDKVVKMAEWGVYNNEREHQVTVARQQAEQIQRDNEQLQQYARQLEVDRERLLASDEAYVQARAQYEAQNTPEARMRRAEDDRALANQRAEFVQAQADGTQYYHGTVLPVVEMMVKALPSVSDEEIGAKLLLVTNRFQVQTPFGSVIPPRAYQAVNQAIYHEVMPWAQSLHESRTEAQNAVARQARQQEAANTAQAKAETRTAQVGAQKAKNQLGRVMKPAARGVTSPTPSPREAPPEKPIKTVQDAEESALAAVMSGMLAGV